MLKCLAIFVVLGAVLPLHSRSQEIPLKHQKDSQSTSHQAEPANRNQSAQPAIVAADPPKENGNKGDQAPSQSQNQSDDHSLDYAKLGFIVSIFVALTSLVVAIASLIQAKAAKQSADDARIAAQFTRNTVKDSERADVLIDEGKLMISPTGIIDEHSWLRIRFRNFGRTRAKNVVVEANMTAEHNNATNQANKIRLRPVTLGPGQERVIDLQKLIKALDPTFLTAVLHGNGRLSFYATVSYEDVFGGAYCPQFTGSYNMQTETVSIDQTS